MKLSPLNIIRTSQDTITTFKGYNHNFRIDDSEFYDMQNLSSDEYPLLSVRPKRAKYFDGRDVRSNKTWVSVDAPVFLDKVDDQEGTYEFVCDIINLRYTLNGEPVDLRDYGITLHPNMFQDFDVKVSSKIEGMIRSGETLYYIRNDTLFSGDDELAELVYGAGERTLVCIGAYICIYPDKLVYNTETGALKNIDSAFSLLNANVEFKPCIVGSEDEVSSNTEPSSPDDGDYWLDTSGDVYVLKVYSAYSDTWTEIATDCVMISATDIGKDFAEGDAVKLSGFSDAPELNALNNSYAVIKSIDANYIVVTGFVPYTITHYQSLEAFVAKRTMPDFAYIIECGNRLWACNESNEIYASKLGDPTNWNCFQGISTDSYAVTVGKEGLFTGAVNYNGTPVFFKEERLYKIFGDYPSNYRTNEITAKGVMVGADKSLHRVGTVLMYKSRDSICVYDGGGVSEISRPFGNIKYNAVQSNYGPAAGSYKGKYYISMLNEKTNEWNMFVYDTSKGLLHREDNTHAKYFVDLQDDLLFYDAADDEVKAIYGTGTEKEGIISWYADTGEIGMQIPSGTTTVTYMTGTKYIARLLVRYSMEIGSSADFYIMYDSNTEWEHIASATGTRLSTMTTEIRPKRCDHFRLRIEGKGPINIYSIAKLLRRGSDF